MDCLGLEASLLRLGEHHHQQIAAEENVHLALRAGESFRAPRVLPRHTPPSTHSTARTTLELNAASIER